jgi:acyl carrier protein
MPVPRPEEIVAVVLRELADVAEVDEDRLTPDAVLEDLDIDSLDMVELGQIIEERFGVQLDRNGMKGVETVDEACRAVIAQVLHQPVT